MRKILLFTFVSALTCSLLTSCALVSVKLTRIPSNQARQTIQSLSSSNHAAALIKQAEVPSLTDQDRITLLVKSLRETSRISNQPDSKKLNRIATTRLIEILSAENFKNPTIPLASNSQSILDPRTPAILIPANTIQIKGLNERVTVDGIGTPYVAWLPKKSPALAKQPSCGRLGMAIPVTAVLRFQDGKPELAFYRRLQTESIRLNGRKETLAADFSAPIAYLLSQGKNRSIDIQALIHSDTNFQNAGLIQIEEYDPEKIPVVFVHGLLSRPEAWTQAVNQLLADPQIRSKYQFWFYLYPTGLPVWWSAAKLRAELDRFRSTLDPAHKNKNLDRMVLVGHSMGGLISSLVVRNGGAHLWKQFTDTPPEKLNISPAAKEHLLKIVNFEARDDIRRVIFVATPHQGSQIALNPFAEFFSSLIRLPEIATSKDRLVMFTAVRSNMKDLFIAPANSIRFLRAKSPLLLSILNLPISERVTCHSVIGDQGKGDTPNSSDGIVPYWSSHFPSAISEKIVPSGHGANENREGIEEIRRILLLHLVESKTR